MESPYFGRNMCLCVLILGSFMMIVFEY